MRFKFFIPFLLLHSYLSAQTTVTNINSSGAGSLYDAINGIAGSVIK